MYIEFFIESFYCLEAYLNSKERDVKPFLCVSMLLVFSL